MSQLIPQETIDTIRQETDIVNVVGEYVQLRKSGKNYLGLCPFHNEKTPSFTVAEEKQIFHCFGCGKGGNVFTFIQEIDGLSFPESVVKLGQMAQVDVSMVTKAPESTGTHNKNERELIAIHEHAKEFFHHILTNTQIGQPAMAYLKERGLTEEIISTFELGFAPKNRSILSQVIAKEGYDSSLMEKSGLFLTRESGEQLDRFFQRIIFPIKNSKGQTIGFSGRLLPEEGFDDSDQPKYLNSPETTLFNKRDVIYNFHRARPVIRKKNEVFLFEGFMDVIAAHISGVENGVATMGTSLTTGQIARLERVAEDIIVVYDGDKAGVEATARATDLLSSSSSLSVQVVSLPQKMDPDDYRMTYGADALQHELLMNKETVFQFKKRYLAKGLNLDNEADKIHYLETILEELSKVVSVLERDMVLTQLSEEFQISKDSLQSQLAHVHPQKEQFKSYNKEVPRPEIIIPQYQDVKKLTQVEKAQMVLIFRILNERSTYNLLASQADFSFANDTYQQLYQHLSDYYQFYGDLTLADFLNYLKEDELKNLLISITMQNFSEESSEQEITDCIAVIRKADIHSQIEQLTYKQKEALSRGDKDLIESTTLSIIKLRQKLNHW